ncbi:MAG TPA: hypothetical protein VMW79_01615 [Anaerolineae bacterium]|nr:hypothetical protein [Anaerolineae bacterium]
MPDSIGADELDLQSLVDQDDPAVDADGLDADLDVPDPEAGDPDADAAAQSSEGEQKNWTPEVKAAYTKATQKYSATVHATEAKAAAAAAKAEAAQREVEFLRSQLERSSATAAPTAPNPKDPEVAQRAQMLDELFKQTPTYKAMQASLDSTQATARSAMAAMPETFIKPGTIDKATLAQIIPELRDIASRQKQLDPNTIQLIATNLAAPIQTARIQAHETAVAKARQSKKAALQKASTPSSGGLEATVKDFGAMSLAEQDALLETMGADFDKQINDAG